mgnify:CR=1|tara:strand:- start:7081 stop:7686 length:606 start_codon:yes stop_codon:yes gene_type:complete
MANLVMDGVTLASKSGSDITIQNTNVNFPAGMVIEQFLLPCNGSSITVKSGTYTSENVTAFQDSAHGSFADITGSSITYTPPTGAQLVIYKYILQIGYSDSFPKLSIRVMLGEVEADKFRAVYTTENYLNAKVVLEYPFIIGGSADATIGRQATWTSGVEIKLQMQSVSGNDATLNQADFYGNSSDDILVPPMIGITTIAG